MPQSIGQRSANRLAGQALDNFLKYQIGVPAAAATTAGVSHLLRGGVQGPLTANAARLAGGAGAAASVLAPMALVAGTAALGNILSGGDSSGGDDKELEYLRRQALQERRLQNQRDLIQARAEARTPGRQVTQGEELGKYYEGLGYYHKQMADAEKTASEVGEKSMQDMMNFGRSIYGTGLRA
tara:strand:- start:3437 stop:3985 length:549 start_codon:yes stop_codon:yes gene_type:complete